MNSITLLLINSDSLLGGFTLDSHLSSRNKSAVVGVGRDLHATICPHLSPFPSKGPDDCSFLGRIILGFRSTDPLVFLLPLGCSLTVLFSDLPPGVAQYVGPTCFSLYLSSVTSLIAKAFNFL